MKTSIYDISYKLAVPISVSFHTFTHSEHVLLELRDNIVAFGEASPFEPITRDTKQDNIDAFKHIGKIPIEKIWIDDIPRFTSKTKSHTSQAAIDMALHDMIGKREGKPVYRLYSKKMNLVPNTVTLYISDTNTTKERLALIQKDYKGIKAIKIKLYGNEHDFDRVKNVVDLCPYGTKFILDANRGFVDKELAIKILNKISDYTKQIVAFEEPYRFTSPRELKEITDNVSMPIFGDESITSMAEAKALVENDAIKGINIKIQKMGGIFESKKIAEFADENNLKLMVGCMLESPLSISAGVSFAVSTKNVIITDLDYDLDLPDYFGSKPKFKNGIRIPNEGSGLGVDMEIEKFKAAKDSNLVFREVK